MRGLIALSRVCSVNIKLINKNFVNFSVNRNITLLPVCCHQWGSKKQHRKIKLHFSIDTMADPKIEEILAPLRASVKEQVIFMYNKINLGYVYRFQDCTMCIKNYIHREIL